MIQAEKEVSPGELLRHVKSLHGTDAKFIKSEPVEESFDEQIVWQGFVHTFELIGHAKTDACFAWSSPVEGSDNRKFYAVLKIPPIETAQDAVKAAIISDFKNKGNN